MGRTANLRSFLQRKGKHAMQLSKPARWCEPTLSEHCETTSPSCHTLTTRLAYLQRWQRLSCQRSTQQLMDTISVQEVTGYGTLRTTATDTKARLMLSF